MTAGMRFRAYGMVCDSDLAMDEVVHCADENVDVRIRKRPVTPSPGGFEGFRNHSVNDSGDLLEYRDVGRFLVRDASTIDVDLDPGFDARLIGLPLLGPVLSLLAHRRGKLVLHGSAVMIDGQAHVFLGDKGDGKSTTALALVKAGCPLVSDDVIVLQPNGNGEMYIEAGFASMKLDVAMLADFAPGSYTVLQPDEGLYTGGKSRIRLEQPPIPHAVPLAHIHCLKRGAANAMAPLSAAMTLHALIRFAHFPRLGPNANLPHETAGLFALAAEHAPNVKADLLTVKHSLAELGQIAGFLKDGERNDKAAA